MPLIHQQKCEKPFLSIFCPFHAPCPLAVQINSKAKRTGLYGDVLMEIDWSVGEIMKTLEANGIDDNTL